MDSNPILYCSSLVYFNLKLILWWWISDWNTSSENCFSALKCSSVSLTFIDMKQTLFMVYQYIHVVVIINEVHVMGRAIKIFRSAIEFHPSYCTHSGIGDAWMFCVYVWWFWCVCACVCVCVCVCVCMRACVCALVWGIDCSLSFCMYYSSV